MAELLEGGCTVLVPYGQNQAYDLVVDRGSAGFARIQVKTGWERDGCVHFNSAATDHGQGHGHRDYRGRADYFGVYVPSLVRVFVVPVESAATRRTYLRVRPTLNRQARRVRLAEEYAIEHHLAALRPLPGPGPADALAA